MVADPFDLEVSDEQFEAAQSRREPFLAGPIPWRWLTRAMALPGRACAVGLEIWHVAGLTKSRTVSVNLSRMPFDRSAAGRGLAELEHAGLVTVLRVPGRKPRITIVDSNWFGAGQLYGIKSV